MCAVREVILGRGRRLIAQARGPWCVPRSSARVAKRGLGLFSLRRCSRGRRSGCSGGFRIAPCISGGRRGCSARSWRWPLSRLRSHVLPRSVVLAGLGTITARGPVVTRRRCGISEAGVTGSARCPGLCRGLLVSGRWRGILLPNILPGISSDSRGGGVTGPQHGSIIVVASLGRGITKDLEGSSDLLKFDRGTLFVVGISIRMALQGQLVIRPLDIIGRCGGRQT